MNEKRILVTAATGGIGSALCEYLVKKNYSIIMTSRSKEKLTAIAGNLNRKYPSKVFYSESDYAHPDSFQNMLTLLKKGIDGIVLMPPPPIKSADHFPSTEQWEKNFKEGFIGPLALLKDCLSFLKVNTKIVIVLGINSIQVFENYALNNVLSTAWLAQAKTLAFALAKEKIHVNTLSIGGVLTEKHLNRFQNEAEKRGITLQEVIEERAANVPLKKYATPLEIAEVIGTLLSDFTSHITGQNIICDGGFIKSY